MTVTFSSMGPRDEFRSSYPRSNRGLIWALVTVSVLALAAGITALALWQSRPTTRTDTVPNNEVEQITSQEIRQQFPGPPVVVTCPDQLRPKVGAAEECVMKRLDRKYRLTIELTQVRSPTDVNWRWELGDEIS